MMMENKRIIIGVDIGITQSTSAYAVISDSEVIQCSRFLSNDGVSTAMYITKLAEKFTPAVIAIDRHPYICEALQAKGLPIRSSQISRLSKEQKTMSLKQAIEKNVLEFPNAYGEQTSFDYIPEDIVIALALAWSWKRNSGVRIDFV